MDLIDKILAYTCPGSGDTEPQAFLTHPGDFQAAPASAAGASADTMADGSVHAAAGLDFETSAMIASPRKIGILSDSELQSRTSEAIEEDNSYRRVQRAKFKSVEQMMNYDQFQNMVRGAHLNPVNLSANPVDSIASSGNRRKLRGTEIAHDAEELEAVMRAATQRYDISLADTIAKTFSSGANKQSSQAASQATGTTTAACAPTESRSASSSTKVYSVLHGLASLPSNPRVKKTAYQGTRSGTGNTAESWETFLFGSTSSASEQKESSPSNVMSSSAAASGTSVTPCDGSSLYGDSIRDLWTRTYLPATPNTPQEFDTMFIVAQKHADWRSRMYALVRVVNATPSPAPSTEALDVRTTSEIKGGVAASTVMPGSLGFEMLARVLIAFAARFNSTSLQSTQEFIASAETKSSNVHFPVSSPPALTDPISPWDAYHAWSFLRFLTKLPRFDMSSAFLTEGDRVSAETVLSTLLKLAEDENWVQAYKRVIPLADSFGSTETHAGTVSLVTKTKQPKKPKGTATTTYEDESLDALLSVVAPPADITDTTTLALADRSHESTRAVTSMSTSEFIAALTADHSSRRLEELETRKSVKIGGVKKKTAARATETHQPQVNTFSRSSITTLAQQFGVKLV